MKKFSQTLLIVVLVILLGLAGLLGWLTMTEFNPDPIEDLEPISYQASTALPLGATVDLLSWNIGYSGLGAEQDFLLPLEDLFADDPAIAPSLVSATVILSDNRTEALLDDSVVYQAVTEERVVAVDLSGTALAASLSASEGRTQPVYLAIIRNTPRPDAAAACVRQLFAQ